jgi:hypothetical protein
MGPNDPRKKKFQISKKKSKEYMLGRVRNIFEILGDVVREEFARR